ncbi:hypothetical protein K469DRAFT_792323 [Zopfia rhizophila CBS 207.26]|uniref:Uncharacterized protein n=1 Tax=Zopfia rhizophila CBS 207.26 TaxID=1314779 RepID=A0A6A6DUA6_9PEZI|nr:hypothetical protein K469DRAFT_792323 [Zopfia rhizophila CBS 207.26]
MARDIGRRRLTTKRKRRGNNLLHKIYEFETKCGMRVAFFAQNPDNNQIQMYVPRNGVIWFPSLNELSEMEPSPRRIHAQDFETKENISSFEPNPSRIRRKPNNNTVVIDLTLPEPPAFLPTRREEGSKKEEEQRERGGGGEVYIKEEEKDDDDLWVSTSNLG